MKRAPASSPGGGGAPPPAAEESRPWTSSEVQALLAVWADPVVQDELDSCVRNEKVFAKIQMRLLQRSGSSRSVKQVREKIKRLKADYKRLKEQSRRAGGGDGGGGGGGGRDAARCKHFELMDAVLGREGGPSPPAGVSDSRGVAGGAAAEPPPVKSEPPYGDSRDPRCAEAAAAADSRCGEEEGDEEEVEEEDKKPEVVHPPPPRAPPPNSASSSTNTRRGVTRWHNWGSKRERAAAAAASAWARCARELGALLVQELRADRELREQQLRQLLDFKREQLRAEQQQRALELSSYNASNVQLVSILGQIATALGDAAAAAARDGGARQPP